MALESADKGAIMAEFKELDKDGSGYLSRDELKDALKRLYENIDLKLTDANIQALLNQADKNKDGKIQIEEFMTLI
ncbi:EF-hand domain-containing protein [Pseudanabaena sp. UWO310]|uniref:EF-hand domain-containing protein n=1 Tax=Pseudanabaena sp. UWO310 TaxID=2480795 RepID=UPI00115C0B04|nr:EF-hand domain-containing protein [Pseudanabaena sp. UWO310]TYQ31111.1 EF-hand domain-containing protein [Pseudanabaena sp. UWO310]